MTSSRGGAGRDRRRRICRVDRGAAGQDPQHARGGRRWRPVEQRSSRTVGTDEALDYRRRTSRQVAKALPDSIDAFFENVGVMPVLMEHFHTDAKMTICGTIMNYSSTELPTNRTASAAVTLIHYVRSTPAFAGTTSWTPSPVPRLEACR